MSYTVLLQYNAKIIDNSEIIRNYGWIEINTCEVYSMQRYVIKFVSDMRGVSDFLRVLRFPSPIKRYN
jgi:hypothetical protein